MIWLFLIPLGMALFTIGRLGGPARVGQAIVVLGYATALVCLYVLIFAFVGYA